MIKSCFKTKLYTLTGVIVEPAHLAEIIIAEDEEV